MNKILGLLLFCAAMHAHAQASTVQTCELGDLKLESGEVIRNFRMTYITHGTLNAQKSNAILSIAGPSVSATAMPMSNAWRAGKSRCGWCRSLGDL
jgi:homoserine acetyltransferase